MADIHIHRKHQLGLAQARKIALAWAEKAEEKFDMECTYEEGDEQDRLCFTRAGIKGTLDVLPDALDFHAQLGFLVSAFKERIETELNDQIDGLLGAAPSCASKPKAAKAEKTGKTGAAEKPSKTAAVTARAGATAKAAKITKPAAKPAAKK